VEVEVVEVDVVVDDELFVGAVVVVAAEDVVEIVEVVEVDVAVVDETVVGAVVVVAEDVVEVVVDVGIVEIVVRTVFVGISEVGIKIWVVVVEASVEAASSDFVSAVVVS